MKTTGTFTFLAGLPYLEIDSDLMARIHAIVDLAPEEAQWFHEVERVIEGDRLGYRLSGMYVPEQICSRAEVDSTGEMLIKLYQELKGKVGKDEAYRISSRMTAWAHSHNTMGVTPSGQDLRQFQEHVLTNQEAGNTQPTLMLIFNKNGDCSCRIWDPITGIKAEGLPLVERRPSFPELADIAKARFKKPAPRPQTIQMGPPKGKPGTPKYGEFSRLVPQINLDQIRKHFKRIDQASNNGHRIQSARQIVNELTSKIGTAAPYLVNVYLFGTENEFQTLYLPGFLSTLTVKERQHAETALAQRLASHHQGHQGEVSLTNLEQAIRSASDLIAGRPASPVPATLWAHGGGWADYGFENV